jgi:hypothetical protein
MAQYLQIHLRGAWRNTGPSAKSLLSSFCFFGRSPYGSCGFMLGHRSHVIFIIAGAWTPLFFYFLRPGFVATKDRSGRRASRSFRRSRSPACSSCRATTTVESWPADLGWDLPHTCAPFTPSDHRR